MTVVDERLKVRGVRGFRIAHMSIMPTLKGVDTQMPAYVDGLLDLGLTSKNQVRNQAKECRHDQDGLEDVTVKAEGMIS